jgi:cell volume regulation protein A
VRDDAPYILAVGLLLTAGLAASLLAGRVRLPSLVLFLGVGMIVGTDGVGLIRLEFEQAHIVELIGVLALALILFEGGLTAGWPEVKPVFGPAAALALLGTLLTALVTGAAATLLFEFSWLQGMLLGAVIASTDGAAIFALLRNSTLKRRLARTLEAEAGLNDPVAVLLVLGFMSWIEEPDYGLADLSLLFVSQLGIGAVVGLGIGWLGVRSFQMLRLESAGLYPVASLAIGATAYGAAATIGGSGFLAIYLVGLALGGAAIPAKRTIVAFHQGMAWVGQLSMFLALGLLVFPHQLPGVVVEGTVMALVVVLVARPLATAISTLNWSFSLADRIVLAWAGLKGAVPVVLATFPVIEEVEGAREIFNIVFFAVLLSTLLQGTTFEPLARRLGATTTEPALPTPLAEAGTIRRLGAEILEYPVGSMDAIAGARVRDLALPRDAVVNVIVRGEQAIPPRGSTRLLPGDRLHIMLRHEMARQLPALMARWREGPIGPPARPPRALYGRAAIFTVRPWGAPGDAPDPSRPETVGGVDVVDLIRIRRDEPGSLAALADGRYAVTGRLVVVGDAARVSASLRQRLAQTDSDAERAWLQTVIGAVATDNVAPGRA